MISLVQLKKRHDVQNNFSVLFTIINMASSHYIVFLDKGQTVQQMDGMSKLSSTNKNDVFTYTDSSKTIEEVKEMFHAKKVIDTSNFVTSKKKTKNLNKIGTHDLSKNHQQKNHKLTDKLKTHLKNTPVLPHSDTITYEECDDTFCASLDGLFEITLNMCFPTEDGYYIVYSADANNFYAHAFDNSLCSGNAINSFSAPLDTCILEDGEDYSFKFTNIAPTPSCNDDWLGDGFCDALNNNAECNYDNGDCCPDCCVDADYTCGVNGFTCLDPECQPGSGGFVCAIYDEPFNFNDLYGLDLINQLGTSLDNIRGTTIGEGEGIVAVIIDSGANPHIEYNLTMNFNCQTAMSSVTATDWCTSVPVTDRGDIDGHGTYSRW